MRPRVLIRGWDPPLQLISAGTQRAAQRRDISEDNRLREGGGLWRKGQNRELRWGVQKCLGDSRVHRGRHGRRGRRSGAGVGDGRGAGAGGRAVARRAARAQRSWVAAGCWCWLVGRESPPRWHQAPSHTWPVSSQGGVRPPRSAVPSGCHRRAPAAPPHLRPPACGSALRHRGLSNEEGRGRPRPERLGRGDRRKDVQLQGPLRTTLWLRWRDGGPCFGLFYSPQGGNKMKRKNRSIGQLLIKH